MCLLIVIDICVSNDNVEIMKCVYLYKNLFGRNV